MEVMFIDPQYLPVVGSLVAGGLLFVMAIGAVVYGWLREEPPRAKAEREPLELKKAA